MSRPLPQSHAVSPRTGLPDGIGAVIDALAYFEDRAERVQALIDIAERFEDVPSEIAERPFDAARRVAGCESGVYVFESIREDGTLDFYIAVENPQGISARALAVILQDTLSGAPLTEVASLESQMVGDIFGELSLNKQLGLGGMIEMVRAVALRELEKRVEVG